MAMESFGNLKSEKILICELVFLSPLELPFAAVADTIKQQKSFGTVDGFPYSKSKRKPTFSGFNASHLTTASPF